MEKEGTIEGQKRRWGKLRKRESARAHARERERERVRGGYTPAAPAVEVVRALLVACSRTYTLDRTFDLGSRGIADDLGPYVTSYVERGGRLVRVDRDRKN